MPCSDYSGNHTKLNKILLNGNNICMVSSSIPDPLEVFFWLALSNTVPTLVDPGR
jgi:hypothetical protein